MLNLTPSAADRLRRLLHEHPEDPIVRITLRDLDTQRLALSITLEAAAQPDDDVAHIDGITVARERSSLHRTTGMTVDYDAATGFRFIHPAASDPDLIMPSPR